MPTVTGRATDFITFSRTSNATVTDSNGLIKWAGHNLLTNSESFDASAWRKQSVTVTANFAAAPNGTTTADRAVYVGGLGTPTLRLVDQQVTMNTAGISLTLAIWVSGTGKFRLKNTHVGVLDNFSSDITATATPTLYTLAVTNGSTNGGSQQVGIVAATTDDAFDLCIWGAHMYRSDLGGMVLNPARGDAYYPTTPRNLLGFTESLTTGWTNTNTTDSIVTETNPNGLASSVEVTATAGNGTLLGSVSLTASPYTFSIWLKRKTGTGTVEITVDGTTYVTAAVTSDWQRFSTTLTPSAGTKTPGIRLVTSGDAVYAWGAQLSDSASLDAYSPVYGAAVTSAAYYAPRLDFDPVTLAARGLLVEEQRSNGVIWSQDIDNAAWGKTNLNTSGTPAWINVGVAPDGTTTAEKLIADNTSGIHTAGIAITPVVGTYTASAYVKADGYNFCALQMAFGGLNIFRAYNLTTGAITASAGTGVDAVPVNVGNGWWRFAVTFTTLNTTSDVFRIRVENAGTGANWSGNGTGGILVWGAQLEIGASNAAAQFPTSYIPTNGTAATRTADVASVSTQAFPLGSTEGTIVASATPIGFNVANFITTLQDASLNNFVQHYYQSATNLRVNVVASGGTVAEFDNAVVMGATHKVATAFKANDFASSFNGGSPQTYNTGTVPSGFTTLNIGRRSDGFTFNGHIRQITYIPRRLSNSELQARTV